MAWPSDAGAAGAAGLSSVANDLERPRVLPSSRREAAHTRQLAFSIRRQYSTGMPVNVSSSASCERPIAVKRRHVASSCADVCATVPRPRTSATTSTSPSSAGWLASAARESGGEVWWEETDDGEVADDGERVGVMPAQRSRRSTWESCIGWASERRYDGGGADSKATEELSGRQLEELVEAAA